MSCRRASEQEELIVAKELEIEEMRLRLEESASHAGGSHVEDSSPDGEEDSNHSTSVPLHRHSSAMRTTSKRGRAPPIDPYTGENPEIRFDDWIPSLIRAAKWNDWTESEQLIQLAGHLRGRALQEWNLMEETDKSSWDTCMLVLRERLDQGTKVLATQDFRHTVQKETEKVADYIRRLERVFHIAYGRDSMSKETRQSFLYGQLQEGLRHDLMQNAAVSGALTYTELIMAAKNEEQRQSELKKRRNYQFGLRPRESKDNNRSRPSGANRTFNPASKVQDATDRRLCYNCGKPGHIAKNCRTKKSESKGGGNNNSTKQPNTRQVQTENTPSEDVQALQRSDVSQPEHVNPSGSLLSCLYSSEGDDSVLLIRVEDQGSQSQWAKVSIQGFSTDGIIDSGADITIMNGDLFKKIAAAAHLKKRDLKPADKSPHAYNRQPFTLDGRMDLEVIFGERAITTPVYIKMEAHDPLLLSEGVCHQLGIISYHPEVRCSRKISVADPSREAVVPMVKIQLIDSAKVLPQQSVQVTAKVEKALEGTWLLEPDPDLEDLESVLKSLYCKQESLSI